MIKYNVGYRERGSVWDKDFYREFEKRYPDFPHSEASDIALKRPRKKWDQFRPPES